MFRKKAFLPLKPDWWQAGVFLTIGAGAGAGLMYLLDPDRGAGRRALLRDKAVSTAHEAEKSIARQKDDLKNRIVGAAARTRSRFQAAPIPDDTLVARVRAELGHLVSHPKAVEVQAHQGVVTLRGAVAPTELQPLLQRVRHVRGVQQIENQLAAAA